MVNGASPPRGGSKPELWRNPGWDILNTIMLPRIKEV
jgi:hypothetical protein